MILILILKLDQEFYLFLSWNQKFQIKEDLKKKILNWVEKGFRKIDVGFSQGGKFRLVLLNLGIKWVLD